MLEDKEIEGKKRDFKVSEYHNELASKVTGVEEEKRG
jgi:hypothetical protein